MDPDGWITPRKRARINPDVILIDDEEECNSTSTPSSSSSGPQAVCTSSSSSVQTTSGSDNSVSLSVSTRNACQYGSKCYRRNPNHLLEYSHPLLENVYQEMEKARDFSKIPTKMIPELNKVAADTNAVLEQIQVLKAAEFNPRKTKISPVDLKNTVKSSTSSVTASSSSTSTGIIAEESQEQKLQNSLHQVREERRRKYLEAQKNRQNINTPKDNAVKNKPEGIRNMLEKWEASCPFNFFLTKVSSIPNENQNVLSANFVDLFDSSLGEVKALMHVNYMIDPEWILDQFTQAGLEGKPTWIIFNGDSKDLVCEYTWLKVFGVKSPFPYGHHHTKMSIVQYTDCSVRFFIYTANLIDSDWDNRTQGIWISPSCPKLVDIKASATAGDSCTQFKSDIIQYLSTYPVKASAAWIDVIKGVDCSQIKVYLIASAPVTAQSGTTGFQWGTCKIEKILRSLDFGTEPDWPLIIQCSSIGTLGQGPQDWVQGELGKSLSGKDRGLRGPIHVVYPSHSNVKESFEGLYGGGCLPYSVSTHLKQKWLERHLCQWKADRSGRSKAVPHIKSYCRISPDNSKMAWFLLTSANLSKAAWGKLNKKGDRLSVMSWEAGVLFVPQLLISQNHFPISDGDASTDSTNLKFPLHLDIPVVKYEKNNKPWFFETLQALVMQNK